MPEPRRVTVPVRGASNASAFIDSSGLTNPLTKISNLEVENADTDRPQPGTRPGLKRLFGRRFGSLAGQAAVVATRAAVIRAANCRDLGAGVSKAAGPLVGNVWQLDPVPSMAFAGYVDVTGDGGPAGVQCDVVGWARDGASFAGGTTWGSPGTERWRVTCWTTSGAVRFSVSGTGWINSVCFSERCLYILGATSSYTPRLYKVRLSDGVMTQLTPTWLGWFGEMIRGRFWKSSAGVGFLLLAAYGNPNAGGWVGGHLGPLPPGHPDLLEAGIPVAHFMSGVIKLRLDAVGANDEDLVQVQYSTPLPSSDPYWQTNHGYFRVAEKSIARPHGCYITDMSEPAADGSVVCTRTNQGWGWSSAWRPTGLTRPYISCFMLNANGDLVWEADTASIRGDGSGSGSFPGNPHYNDILDPTLRAAALGNGYAWVAGRINDGGNNWFKIAADDGAAVLAGSLVGAGQRTYDGGLAIDVTDQNPVFTGDRNNTWPDATGNAHLWKLDSVTGAVLTTFDLNEAVNSLTVAISPAGDVLYGTEKVT